jgi:hypothetical protein
MPVSSSSQLIRAPKGSNLRISSMWWNDAGLITIKLSRKKIPQKASLNRLNPAEMKAVALIWQTCFHVSRQDFCGTFAIVRKRE